MPSRKPSPLAARLAQLEITAAEVAKIASVPVETVEDWIKNGPDAEGKVLTRWLADDADALRRICSTRRTFKRNYAEGDRGALNITSTTVGPPVRDGERYGGVAA
jgi:hypothetical protein